MQVKCTWELAPPKQNCAVSGCPKEGHLVCHDHPAEGYYCARHRSVHTRSVAKRNLELDSRPRELVRARRVVTKLEDPPGASR